MRTSSHCFGHREGVGLAAGVAALLAAAGVAAGQAQFVPLGTLDGVDGESYAWGISGDGQTVVGQSRSATSGLQFEGFKRVGSGPLENLGYLNSQNRQSVAYSVNNTGTVIVGTSRYNALGVLQQAWRQSSPGAALSPIPFPNPGASALADAQGVSADGTVVVGWASTTAGLAQATRFDSSTGQVRFLGTLNGDPRSFAYGVSDDGAVVVGQSAGTTRTTAFTWVAGRSPQLQALPAITGPNGFGEAWGVSPLGNVVVGDSVDATGGLVAVAWDRLTAQITVLGDLPGGDTQASAYAASGDGSVIVGSGSTETSGFEGEAFIWDAAQGIRALKDVLAAQGVDLTGWRLFSAQDISFDGQKIVGYGRNPQGRIEGWLVVLPRVPVCVADYGGDGQLNVDDLSDFITDYFTSPAVPGPGGYAQANLCTAAPAPYNTQGFKVDINADCIVNVDDLSDYITAYFAGC